MKNIIASILIIIVLSGCQKDISFTDSKKPISAAVTQNVFSISGKNLLLNGTPFKIIGLRCSNALISDVDVTELVNNLDVFKGYGINTVSVYIMGSRFGNIKGFNPDASLNTPYAWRLGRIIEAANQRGMVVLVGCLYWSTSTAKDDLGHWTQTHANLAVANTVKWLKAKNYRNVFVDPDNEGMAQIAKGWNVSSMIAAGKAIDPSYMIGYNSQRTPVPANANILLHHSPKDNVRPYVETEGTPSNAPGGYWGTYSKLDGYYNYIRIGRYTSSMKSNQINGSYTNIDSYQGYMLASTWLQCVPPLSGAPFMKPGGNANGDVNNNVKTINADAGILWWLTAIKNRYGAWNN